MTRDDLRKEFEEIYKEKFESLNVEYEYMEYNDKYVEWLEDRAVNNETNIDLLLDKLKI